MCGTQCSVDAKRQTGRDKVDDLVSLNIAVSTNWNLIHSNPGVYGDGVGEGVKTSSVGSFSPTADAIIPKQNKGLCSCCDRAVWTFNGANSSAMMDVTGTTGDSGINMKWCKGCKNMLPWSSYGEKKMATKCDKCRGRQKTQYAELKKSKGSVGDWNDSAESVAESIGMEGMENIENNMFGGGGFDYDDYDVEEVQSRAFQI